LESLEVKSIVIVGGGSSGWMSAAHLINEFPDKKITVIESPNFPTIGVGESTIQYIRPWMYNLGIKDEDWMDACNATYKVSIRFENWDGKDGHFHYPFGQPIYNNDIDFDYYNFARLKDDIPSSEWAEIFFPAALMAENDCLVDKMEGWDLSKNSAYHFDAIKFAQWLKNEYCIPRGVELIADTVSSIDVEGEGIIKIHCEEPEHRNENAIVGDLYIDCTGFKGMLIDAVGCKFRDYGYGLINDSAWATQLPKTQPNRFYTNCTTLKNGWVWNTPTKERTGTGYVFSSKYTSAEEARKEFEKHLGVDENELTMRLLTWKHGRREKFSYKNVVAIGLSAGFIEPLESGGLFTTHETLKELSKSLQRGVFGGAEKEGFNFAMTNRFDDFADFVVMHYQFATRCDTKYWMDASKRKLNNNNALNEFYTSSYKDSRTIPSNAHYNSIAFGLGFNPVSQYDVSYEKLFANVDMVADGVKFRKWLKNRQSKWLDYIKENAINR
jgi:tryptophan halogenase